MSLRAPQQHSACFLLLIFFSPSAFLLYTHIYFCPQSHGFAVHAKRILWIFWMKIELWEKKLGTQTGVSSGSSWFTGWAGRWVPAFSWYSLPQHSPAFTLYSWPLITDDSKNTYSNGIPLPLEVHGYGLPSLQETDPGMCTWMGVCVCVCVCVWQLELKMCCCDKIKAELRSLSSKSSLMWLKVHWSPRRDTCGINQNMALRAEGKPKDLKIIWRQKYRGSKHFKRRRLASRIDLNTLPGDLFGLLVIKGNAPLIPR